MPTAVRLFILAVLVALAVTTRSERAPAHSTPTAEHQCEAAVEASEHGTPVPATPSDPGLDVTSLEFDLLFLEAMIPHHEMARQMAQVAADRAERPELKEFAASIMNAQKTEIDTMREWRQSWYPNLPPLTERQIIDGMTVKLSDSPGMGGVAGVDEMGMEQMVEDIIELCAATDDFDLLFIDLMLGHHSSAIVLSQEAVNLAEHREVREMATAIAAAKQYEVDQMLTWREQWYPDAPFREHEH